MAGIPIGATSTYCYTGSEGSQAQDCTVNLAGKGGEIDIGVNNALPANNGFTVSVSVPKGYIANTVQTVSGSGAGGSNAGSIIIFIIVILFIVLSFVLTVVRLFRGGKKKAIIPKELRHIPIAPYYSVPDNLPPSLKLWRTSSLVPACR
ncbi:MAG: hypothetical protein WCF77_03990 [Minisyncoccia bacterium]